jgi:hypothetical protein
MMSSSPASTDPERHLAAIEALVESSHSPFELVEKLYRNELSRLQPEARITQYLPLLTTRRTREALRLRQKP